MRSASSLVVALESLPCRLAMAILLSLLAPGVHAQNKCSASGVIGGEKFAANNCAAALRTGADAGHDNSVAIWFNEDPISAEEVAEFQVSSATEDKKGGKERTLVVIMFCPGGGSSKASATAIKSIDVHANHAKSTFLGIQTVVEAPKDFKVEKISGEVIPGGALSGRIVGSAGKTTFNLDFNVTLPAKEASAGIGCSG
jgi:hypothetical protein